ncbi:ArsR family transcriptional regulator [Streptomyces sp. NBC_00124]|uniref:ArsR family transcriptional regulator n=1 Tax=Streptomyces sp. NBC_00124 TaxID=2975662 RepID=UPI00338F4E90
MVLTALHRAACSVTELATVIGVKQSAVSHQLRLLRALDLAVKGRRTGCDAGQPLDERLPK